MSDPRDITLGIDLGGTNIKAVWVTPSGEVVRRETVSTGDLDSSGVWRDHILEIALGHPGRVGLAAPGLADCDGKMISFMPGRLQGLENFDWSAHLKTHVRVLNDAHAALLGETWLGAARGRQHVIMLTLGTGVGGAVLANGRLLRGAIGRAGHLGHISVNFLGKPDIVATPGSLEDAIGDCTVQARTGYASTLELVMAAKAGDTKALHQWEQSVTALAAGIVGLINAFDPELIVLGGGIIAAGDMLFSPLERALERMEWRPAGHRVPIARAQLAEWAGAMGAAAYALYGDDQDYAKEP